MNEKQALNKAYVPFRNRFTLDNFLTKVNNLEDSKWNFVRACLLYQKALSCKRCEPNVAMVLLCSCAEAIKITGSWESKRNFREFYLRYCPADKRGSPIKYYRPGKRLPPQPASFDKALDFIYSKFRSLYVHEGIGRLETPPEDITLFKDTLLDAYKGKIYIIDKEKILEWFADITLESLHCFLKQTRVK